MVTDPRAQQQPFTGACCVNLPAIALCNTDFALHYENIAIPCNNMGTHSSGLIYAGTESCVAPSSLNIHGRLCLLSTYRDPEESEKEDKAGTEKAVTKKEFLDEWIAPAPLKFTANSA